MKPYGTIRLSNTARLFAAMTTATEPNFWPTSRTSIRALRVCLIISTHFAFQLSRVAFFSPRPCQGEWIAIQVVPPVILANGLIRHRSFDRILRAEPVRDVWHVCKLGYV